MELNELPLVLVKDGSVSYSEWNDFYQTLEAAFPNQDSYNFLTACECNDWGPLTEHSITGLLLVKQGERDEEDWIWLVTLRNAITWWVQGGCDYTGWDCQSSLDWYPFQAAEVEQMAKATWSRCRSLRERKENVRWDTLSDAEKTAWQNGVLSDLYQAGLTLTKGK